MTSRLLTGEATQPAERIAWKRLGPPPGSVHTVAAAAANRVGEADAGQALKARIGQLERELVEREQAALKTGLEKGRVAGEQEASARLKAVVERFTATVDELASSRRRFRHEAEADVVKLALAIARRVLHRELNSDPEAVFGLVKAALEKVDSREIERIRIHPADAPMVTAQLDKLRPATRFEVVPDSRLERGAAVVETARGSLDASVETQLDEIERGLAERLRS
jgi:flagellar assembly protein FliH